MNQAEVVYRRNVNPAKGLAVAGIVFVKWLLAIPHLIIVSILGSLAMVAGYIGYFIVAFTGKLPDGIQTFVSMWMRWYVRTYGWVAGIADEYPPFETDPARYGIDAKTPHNDNPSKGWAVAGIFFVKFLVAVPHLIVIAVLSGAMYIAIWIGYFVVAFTGKLPDGIQNFVAGTYQWLMRVMAWITGLTDEYPPFSLEISPQTSA
jgi:hypothetical protein